MLEPQAGARESSVAVTYWQLRYQPNDGLILNVAAFAPAADFATSEVGRVVRTFDASAAA